MRSRSFRIALLAFQAIWLNAIVPGHTRGIVTLAGGCHDPSAGVSAQGTRCCPTKSSKSNAPKQKADHCAVCHFAARITPPPVIDLSPPRLALTPLRVEVLPRSADSADLPPAYYGRGPPVP